MVDEQQPAKKVVKRVVKKTVVRPPADSPTVRYGRPAPTTPARPQAKVASRGSTTAPGTTTTRPRPTADVGAKVGAAGKALSTRGASLASRAAGAAGSAGRTTSTFAAERFRSILAWRIPHLDPRPASAVTGFVVGAVAVGLALGALEIFSSVRGVSSGGGRWGTLTFVVVTFIAIVVGDLLLRAFGAARPGLTSFLGAVLSIVAILGLFLEVAETRWALLLLPTLGAITYLAAHMLLKLADSVPTMSE